MSEQQERPKPKRVDSEVSSTAEEDPGYESRSRSQSRRRRRQNQRQRQVQTKAQAGNSKADSMAAVQEQPQEEQEQEQEDSPYAPQDQWLSNPATAETTEAQPFSRIKPPSQSMDGPVTYARMMRGEIPWKGPPPRQPYETTQGVDAKGNDGKDPMDQDGLKLRLELNLDIEIELKASIHGDLTLALL